MLSMEHRVIFPGNEHHTAAFAVQGVYSGGEQIIVIVQPSGTFSKHGKSGNRLFFGRPVQAVPALDKAFLQRCAAAGAAHRPSSSGVDAL